MPTTLIIVESRNPLEPVAGPRAPPIIEEFLPMRQRPFFYKPRRNARQLAFYDLTRLDFDEGFVLLVDGVEMRRGMIAQIHADEDAIEGRDRWHQSLVRTAVFTSASCADKLPIARAESFPSFGRTD
jgi:hypothetical protein